MQFPKEPQETKGFIAFLRRYETEVIRGIDNPTVLQIKVLKNKTKPWRFFAFAHT